MLKEEKEDGGSVKIISRRALRTVKSINSIPQLKQSVWVSGQQLTFEVDTGAGDNFCSKDFWKNLGEPTLAQVSSRYQVANGQPLPVLSTFRASAFLLKDQEPITLAFTVTDVPKLNLLGRDAIVNALVQMPPPTNVSSLRSFLGSVQFYSKFLPNLATVLAPLHQLTKKDTKWKWDSTEEATFRELKKNLCACWLIFNLPFQLESLVMHQRLVLEQSFFTNIQMAANADCKRLQDAYRDSTQIQPNSKRSASHYICIKEVPPVSVW